MKINKQKKSLGFLSIVAFLMILVGVGYTVSSVFAWTSSNLAPTFSPSWGGQSETNPKDPQSPKESFFSSMERQVAEKATSLRNEMLGNAKEPWWPSVDTQLSPSTIEEKKSDSSVTVITLVPSSLPQIYTDIESSAYQEAILILYSQGLLQGGTNFRPNNYVRISDFIRVVMDTYRLQNHYDITNLEGLTERIYFSSNVPKEVLMRINSAYEWWFLTKLALEDADGNPRLDAFISPVEAQEILLAMQKKSPAIVKIPPNLTFLSQETLRRDEMAQLVVSAFWLKLNERSLPVFSDISWTPYQDAIQYLARLGIVGWAHGKFYPAAQVENKDFVTMLVRTLVYRQGKPIVLDNFYYLKPLQDVSTTATYAPYLEYCLEYEMCTALLTQTPWGVRFQANRLLSRSEVIPIVSTASQVKFNLPNALQWEYLTRWELAHLFVNMFQLEESWKFKEESSWENTSTPTTTSINQKSDWKSRRDTFQELMKLQ